MTDAFPKSSSEKTFDFTSTSTKDVKFETIKIKNEVLDNFNVRDEKPNLLMHDDAILKEDLSMKEEQDNAVAALLKQEEEDAKVNEYITNEEKSSALLFDEFTQHSSGISSDKASSSDFLLTPESYNVALQSVVSNNR